MQAFAVFFWIARCCFDNPSTLKAKFYCHGTKETTSSSAVVRAEVRSNVRKVVERLRSMLRVEDIGVEGKKKEGRRTDGKSRKKEGRKRKRRG